MYHFISIWIFFHGHSRFTGQLGKGQAISLTPLYYFHPLHRHLDISRAINAESSPLYVPKKITIFGFQLSQKRLQSCAKYFEKN